jgi:DNA ligase (NAD+)
MDALMAVSLAPDKENIDLFADLTSPADKKIEELSGIPEIGIAIAQSVVEFIANEQQVEIVNRLQIAGLQFALSEEQLEGQTDKLSGKSFVISGVFEMSRNDLKKLIEDNGGKVGSSLSSKTDYLVRGESMGPSKLEKANKLNITMISEQEFLIMV